MDWYSYGTDRWEIRCGSYQGPEQRAVEMLYAGVAAMVPYILVAAQVEQACENSDPSLLLVGTYTSNALIAQVVQQDEIPQEGYLVKVTKSPFAKDRQIVVLAGSDAAQTLYAVSHFLNEYIPQARQNTNHIPYFKPVFEGPLPEYTATRTPAFKERGIWTWGHCIYDYRKLAQNMARLRLNAITIWNDYAPLNLAEVVACFHSYGIKVIFGYSWGWDEGVDISSEQELRDWRDKAIAVYARDYEAAGGDGIYIQSFTETTEETIHGIPIAETVVRWVNTVGAAMLERWPELNIQFGLHATSVKNRLPVIGQVDKRIQIVWEDCGAFPYAYLSRETQAEELMQQFMQEIAKLRGDTPYGVVLKGQVCLDWNRFEHQKGPFVMGCESEEKCRARMEAVKPQWHDVQSYWLQNVGQCRRTLENLKGAAVYDLVEDGLLDEKCWFPVALYAHLLWNDTHSDAEVLQIVAQRPDVTMA